MDKESFLGKPLLEIKDGFTGTLAMQITKIYTALKSEGEEVKDSAVPAEDETSTDEIQGSSFQGIEKELKLQITRITMTTLQQPSSLNTKMK